MGRPESVLQIEGLVNEKALGEEKEIKMAAAMGKADEVVEGLRL